MVIQVIVPEISMKMKKHALQVDIQSIFYNYLKNFILAKRPAKENIEKFLQAEYTLHGLKLFTFLFGKKLSKSIEENSSFWFDTLASAFSGKSSFFCDKFFGIEKFLFLLVAKTIRNFAEKTHMSSEDLAHFQNIIQMIHDGRLEEIPLYAQEAVNQGLASLIEKLYESGFMDHSK
jgi:hypothetical protein